MKRQILLTAFVLCLAFVSAQAQKYWANMQQVCIDAALPTMQYPVAQDCRMYAEDFEIEAGGSCQVTIYLDNTLPIWFLQLQIILPDGLSVTSAKLSQEFISLTNYVENGETHNDNAMTYSWEGERPHELRLLTTNMVQHHPIPIGTHQSVFVITLHANESLTTGTYEVATTLFRFVAATTDEGEGFDGVNTSCQVTVIPPKATDVQVTPASIDLFPGQATTLTATVQPSYVTQTVIWQSQDQNIVTVDEQGRVTAHAVGQTTITATTTEAAQLSATCKVTVNPILASSVSLSQTAAIVKPGATFSLTPTILPENATCSVVDWVSSDPQVATVDAQGTVTVHQRGTAIVTTTTTDGTQLRSSCLVAADCQPDINGDGEYDVVDVNCCINAMLGKTSDPEVIEKSDVNGDGIADISDVNLIINALLYGVRSMTHEFTVNGVTFTMVPVEGNEDVPAFAIAQTETTEALYKAVMGYYSASHLFDVEDNWPATSLDLYRSQEFVNKLNQLTGLAFRIPRYSEWYHAAIGGNRSLGFTYAGSNDIEVVAWFNENSDDHPHPVATKAPNELGLYDMSGNVAEWGAELVPGPHDMGDVPFNYGGGYNSDRIGCRVTSFGFYDYHDYECRGLGLRLAM